MTNAQLVNEQLIREYIAKPYNRILVREEDGRYSAQVLEWPGCYGEGETVEQANQSLDEAMAAWVEVMLEDAEPIPEPLAREYSGRILLRVPRDTHRRVTLRANSEGVSVNQLLLSLIESGLARGRDEPFARRERLHEPGGNWLRMSMANVKPSEAGNIIVQEDCTWGVVAARDTNTNALHSRIRDVLRHWESAAASTSRTKS